MLAERDVAGEPDDHEPRSTQRTPSASGASPSMTPAAVATPFPPLKPTNTEKTWPTTAASPQTSANSCDVRHPRREHQHRDRALRDVEQPDRDGVAPAQHAIQVGGAEVAAAVLAEIDAPEEPAGQ